MPLDKVISSDTSVYVGSFADDYRVMLDTDVEQWVKYKGTGCAKSILANRISWFYDFSGESITLDTACSAGLVAVHLACQNLRLGESKMVSPGYQNPKLEMATSNELAYFYGHAGHRFWSKLDQSPTHCQ